MKILKEFTEIVGLPIILILFVISPYIMLAIDPTAATWDFGVLQTPLVACVLLLAMNLIAFLGFKYNFPKLYKRYLDLEPKEFTEWQIFLSSFCVILLYLMVQLLLILSLT